MFSKWFCSVGWQRRSSVCFKMWRHFRKQAVQCDLWGHWFPNQVLGGVMSLDTHHRLMRPDLWLWQRKCSRHKNTTDDDVAQEERQHLICPSHSQWSFSCSPLRWALATVPSSLSSWLTSQDNTISQDVYTASLATVLPLSGSDRCTECAADLLSR